MRIISLVPSITELLHDLESGDEVVGITKFCIHPANWFSSKQRVGGTKTVDIQLVRSLKPDLIIANKEENEKDQIEELARHCKILLTDVNDLGGAISMIKDIGCAVGKANEANKINDKIQTAFSQLKPVNPGIITSYFIWRNPYMVAGGDTFINDLMTRCGLKNCFATMTRYPQVRFDDLAKKDCKAILLSSEPYPFKEKHIAEFTSQLPHIPVTLVDGEMFSWYGSRLISAPEYFQRLLETLHNYSPG